MDKTQASKRITELENEYGYANSWPVSCQEEYERLCAILWAPKRKLKQA